jgi:predicted PhzF superfamily epimerase YddE/YHI9
MFKTHYTLYQIDAFTDKTFKGNPAAVCVMENWPADELM